jgi:glycosyltransferase involved in cell wall biosynthesis
MFADKRVLFFVPRIGGGGAERAMLLVAYALAESGCDVGLVGYLPEQGGYPIPRHPRLRHFSSTSSKSWSTIGPLREAIRELEAEWVVSTFPDSVAFMASVRRVIGLPRVAYWVQSSLPDQIHRPGHIKHLLRGPIIRRALNASDLVLGCSQDICKQVVAEIGEGAHGPFVVPNPVDMKASKPVYEERLLAKEPGGEVNILSVGRLTAQKDQGVLLEAFAKLTSAVPARLWILGEGPERRSLESQVSAMGLESSVQMPGWVDDLSTYQRMADLFVLSSRWEGMPLAMLEAMACGIPVVSTDCPTGPREVLADGDHGGLVPVGDSERLAEAMEEELMAQRDPITLRMRAEDFSADRVAASFLEIIEAAEGSKG